ncbi:MAG: hypothetical protein JXA87_14515 [Thermoleophilia bacterium]|nr:hypothetical protein [Thermoleophilia bacterium]
MTEASGQSKREMLERLIAELQRLRPDAHESELKDWRARANEAMSDLFGPRHRSTLDLRAVTFTDFAQGRARAVALLRAAGGIAAAREKSQAEPVPLAEPVPRAEPATQAEPEVSESSDGLDAIATPARPRAAAKLDAIAAAAFDAWPEETAELAEAGTTAGGTGGLNDGTTAEPTPDMTAAPVHDTAEPKRRPTPRKTSGKQGSPGAKPVIRDDTMATTPASAKPAPAAQLDSIAEAAFTAWPEATAELLEGGTTAEPLETAAVAAGPTGVPAEPEHVPVEAPAGKVDQPPPDIAAEPLPDVAAEPTAEPTLETAEPKRGSVLRKFARKRDSSGSAPAFPDETADMTSGPSGATEPTGLDRPAESAQPDVPEWPDWPETTVEPVEAGAATEPPETGAAGEPSEAGAATELPEAGAAGEPTLETAESGRASIFQKVTRKRGIFGTHAAIPDGTVNAVAEPATTAEPVDFDQPAEAAEPGASAVPEWPDWFGAITEPVEANAATETIPETSPEAGEPNLEAFEPTSETAGPKRGSVLRKIARKRGISVSPPVIVDETVDAVPAETADGLPAEEAGTVLSEQATAGQEQVADIWSEPVTIGESAVSDRPEWPDWFGATTGPVDTDATAEPIPETVEPTRETIFRRVTRKRGTWRARPVIPADTDGTVAEEAPEEAPLAEALPAELSPAEASAAVVGDLATAQPEAASDIAEPTPEIAEPTPEIAQPALEVAEPALETVEPAPDTTEPKRRSVLRRSARKRGSSGVAPAIFDEPAGVVYEEALEPSPEVHEPAEVFEEAPPRRPRRVRERLTIAAIAIVFLALAVGVPVWLVWFGGLSMFSRDVTTTVTSIATTSTTSGISSPSANSRVIDVADDPRSAYIIDVVRAGIVQLVPNDADEVSFLPGKAVKRGEFLVWLDRVCPIPAGSGDVPDTLYYDLDASLREKAVRAYQSRIVLAWPDEDTKIAFSATDSILARDAEAWAARMIVRLLPAGAVQSGLTTTEEEALDLRARISSLKPEELTRIVEGFEVLPEAGWAQKESISRSEAAEFLMRLKAVFDKHL